MVLKYGGVLTHAGRKQVEFASPFIFFNFGLYFGKHNEHCNLN
jgi:hypothetical protein